MGVIDIVFIDKGLIGFEQQNYWLPLSGSLGPEGLPNGPQRYDRSYRGLPSRNENYFKESPWISFVLAGVLTLLLTSSRVSLVAAVIGLAIVLVLGNNKLSVKVWWRIRGLFVGGIAFLAALAALIASPI